MQGRLVTRATTDDDGQFELADELLEVEGLDGLGDVLGGDDGALDDEDVEAGVKVLAIQSVRAGVTDADVVMPAAFICLMRSATSSSLTGSRYICCIRAVALSSSSSVISSKSDVGSS